MTETQVTAIGNNKRIPKFERVIRDGISVKGIFKIGTK